jgi:hypothetical protein
VSTLKCVVCRAGSPESRRNFPFQVQERVIALQVEVRDAFLAEALRQPRYCGSPIGARQGSTNMLHLAAHSEDEDPPYRRVLPSVALASAHQSTTTLMLARGGGLTNTNASPEDEMANDLPTASKK